MSGSGSSSSDSGCVSGIPRDSFCEDLGSPLSTPAGSSLASPLEEKSCFPKSQYVSAVSKQEPVCRLGLPAYLFCAFFTQHFPEGAQPRCVLDMCYSSLPQVQSPLPRGCCKRWQDPPPSSNLFGHYWIGTLPSQRISVASCCKWSLDCVG